MIDVDTVIMDVGFAIMDVKSVEGAFSFFVSLVTAVGVLYAIRLFYVTRGTAELSNLLDIMDRLNGVENELLAEKDPEKRSMILSQYFNLLETIAMACRTRLLSKQAKKYCESILVQDIGLISSKEDLCKKLVDEVTSADTFEEIAKFYKIHKIEIEAVRDRILGA